MLLTLLGEYVYPADRPLWTRTFVEALAALGFEEAAARQALARSGAAGWLASERSGRQTQWRLTEQARGILEAGKDRIYGFGRGETPWAGEWLLLYVAVPETGRRHRGRLHTRLSWAGFGFLPQCLWISPDPTREAEAAEVLSSLGFADRATSFRAAHAAIGGIDDLVRRAWDFDAVAEHHRRFLAEADGTRPRTRKASFVALTRLVHRWRSLPFVDPDLPNELLPPGWIGRQAACLFHRLHERWSEAAREWWAEKSA
jgi:phenylacetic acid degradation operon negative regulatory protein